MAAGAVLGTVASAGVALGSAKLLKDASNDALPRDDRTGRGALGAIGAGALLTATGANAIAYLDGCGGFQWNSFGNAFKGTSHLIVGTAIGAALVAGGSNLVSNSFDGE